MNITYFPPVNLNAVWGDISGSINEQTDLNDVLNSKAPISHVSDAGIHVTSNDKSYWNSKADGNHNHDGVYEPAFITLDGDKLPTMSASKKGGVPATGTPSNKFLRDDGSWQDIAGGGDMLKSTYDPSNIAANVYSCDYHISGTTNKVFTATEQTKLSGVATGAEVNVNADWNATSGDELILNKPAIPAALSDLSGDSDDITEGVVQLFVNSSEKSTWNSKQDALGFTAENEANKLITFQGTPDNTHYISEKLAKDSLDGKSSIGHNHSGTYEPANANIQSHISSTSNPHSVTKAQVGLSNVSDDAQAKALFTGYTEKTLLVDNDLLLINDSEAGNVIKKVMKSNLVSGGSGSGHTIQNSGSNLTARANLNFTTGLKATDDLVNSASKIELDKTIQNIDLWTDFSGTYASATTFIYTCTNDDAADNYTGKYIGSLFRCTSVAKTVTFTYTTNTCNLTSHGFLNGTAVYFTNSGGALPTGLTANKWYYIVNKTANDFQVALTPGGTAITISDNGTGTHSAYFQRIGYIKSATRTTTTMTVIVVSDTSLQSGDSAFKYCVEQLGTELRKYETGLVELVEDATNSQGSRHDIKFDSYLISTDLYLAIAAAGTTPDGDVSVNIYDDGTALYSSAMSMGENKSLFEQKPTSAFMISAGSELTMRITNVDGNTTMPKHLRVYCWLVPVTLFVAW